MTEKHLWSQSFCAAVIFFKYIVHPTYPKDMKLRDTITKPSLRKCCLKADFSCPNMSHPTFLLVEVLVEVKISWIPKKKLASSPNQLLICSSVKQSCCGNQLLSLLLVNKFHKPETLFASWSIEDWPTKYIWTAERKVPRAMEIFTRTVKSALWFQPIWKIQCSSKIDHFPKNPRYN